MPGQARDKVKDKDRAKGRAKARVRGREKAARHQGQNPGQGITGGGGGGIQIKATASTDDRPAAVKAVGISPSDWAKLPPLMQQQLLNAAQQQGPPAYQDMIKDYVRIAHLQAQGRNERS